MTAPPGCRCPNSEQLASWLADQAAKSLDPKGIGRRAPTTPLDLTLIIASGALSLDPTARRPGQRREDDPPIN